MECMERLKQYEDEDLDKIILFIQRGTIKSGRYAGRIKIDDKFKVRKELFNEGRNRN